jgi:hypothetical protein
MTNHQFIFTPGTWVGEGTINFSTSPETIHFYTKWTVENPDQSALDWKQQVEMRGADDCVYNKLAFSEVSQDSFVVTLENDMIGKASGKGVIDAKTIAWEYRQVNDFEGFEVYELQEDGDYMMHAEYSSTDQYRTVINGRIWKKAT